jgi:hypothetical protein
MREFKDSLSGVTARDDEDDEPQKPIQQTAKTAE